MTKKILGTIITDDNGVATFIYQGKNSGLVNITAIHNDNTSNTLKISDYDLQIADINISENTLIIDHISLSDTNNNTQFITGITYDNGEFKITKNNVNINSIDSVISEIEFNDGILTIRSVEEVLKWL